MSKAIDKTIENLVTIVKRQTKRVQTNKHRETVEELIADVAELEPVVQELIRLQADSKYENEELLAPRSEEQHQAALDKFVEWMAEHAPESKIGDAVGFKVFTEGNGVVALRDIEANEIVLQIPRKVMLTLDDAMKTVVGDLIKRSQLLVNVRSLGLALFLLHERLNPKSFWRPYLDVLPTYLNLPIFCTLDELEALRGSPTHLKALHQYRTTVSHYLEMVTLVKQQKGSPHMQMFSFQAFRWAVATIMARQNAVPQDDFVVNMAGQPVMTMALIPGFDMLNHQHMDGVITTEYDVELAASITHVPTPVPRGGQVYVHYGQRPNSLLFLYQGFVAGDNAFDQVVLPLPALPLDDPLSRVRGMLLNKLGLPQIDFSVPLAREYHSPELQEPPRAVLKTWRDVWKAIWVRVMDKAQLSAALVTATRVFKECNNAQRITPLVQASGEPLFQDDCEGEVKAAVQRALVAQLQALKTGYNGRNTLDSEFKRNAQQLVQLEQALIDQELAALST